MHPSDIDVSLLRAFVVVAETGGMTRAAHALHRTQGAVSQQIARLEALFDTTLFERRARCLVLTATGERLLGGAHRMIAENDTLFGQMRETGSAGEVRFGVPPDIVGALIPDILRRFSQAYPNIQVTLVSEGTCALRRLLREGAVDLMLATDVVAASEDSLLLSDRLVWVGAKDGIAGTRRPLPVALGPEGCAFRTVAVDALARMGIEWRAVCQVGSLEPVIATLEADMAIGAFLSKTVPDRLVPVNAELPKLPMCHVNLVLPPKGLSPVATPLVEMLKSLGVASR